MAEIPFGKLMQLIDMENRWIYKGSRTVPPCEVFVYWNVARRIYPIKARHLALYYKQLARAGNGLEVTGNFRGI